MLVDMCPTRPQEDIASFVLRMKLFGAEQKHKLTRAHRMNEKCVDTSDVVYGTLVSFAQPVRCP